MEVFAPMQKQKHWINEIEELAASIVYYVGTGTVL
jgi:hypothetical protein